MVGALFLVEIALAQAEVQADEDQQGEEEGDEAGGDLGQQGRQPGGQVDEVFIQDDQDGVRLSARTEPMRAARLPTGERK